MKFGNDRAGAVALAFGREALARAMNGLEQPAWSRCTRRKVAELGRGAVRGLDRRAASLDYCVSRAVAKRRVSVEDLPAWNAGCSSDARNPFARRGPSLVLANLGGRREAESMGLARCPHVKGSIRS